MYYSVVTANDTTVISEFNSKYLNSEISQIFDDLNIPYSPIVIESLEDIKILQCAIGCSNHAYKFKLTTGEYNKIFNMKNSTAIKVY